MEHKIIGSIAMGILFVGAIVGSLSLGRYYPIELTARKSKLLVLVLVPLWLILGIGQYYLDNFMSDGKADMMRIVVSHMTLGVWLASIGIGAYLEKKNVMSGTSKKAAPTLK